MRTFCIMGCGHLGTIVANAYTQGLLEGYRLVGAYSRDIRDAKALVEGTGATAVASPAELLALKPDYLIETASIALLKEVAPKALRQGTSVVPLSVGAFADADFKGRCIQEALTHGSKIHIPSGAVGGFDVLNTISLMGQAKGTKVDAGIHTHKGPKSLKGTPLYSDELERGERQVFHGTTAEAIKLLPTKVNVAVATALATTGAEVATSTITSVPAFVGDDHAITAEGEGVKALVDVYSASSDIAGWSVVALLRNLASPIQFF
ncbi:MAG: aspartate dehydrogenase domain-containing protein [Sphaerochaetaceae bacterium]|nr:DUF108 domain-containing protein [Spirochaetales bacterium]MDY5500437.1 aspartate dehydrogenase domain-containing protein [Sphaerochaetaceae bacterium]